MWETEYQMDDAQITYKNRGWTSAEAKHSFCRTTSADFPNFRPSPPPFSPNSEPTRKSRACAWNQPPSLSCLCLRPPPASAHHYSPITPTPPACVFTLTLLHSPSSLWISVKRKHRWVPCCSSLWINSIYLSSFRGAFVYFQHSNSQDAATGGFPLSSSSLRMS